MSFLFACSYGSTSAPSSSATPYDYAVGPHGEPLVQVQCFAPAECMASARHVCGGDFDIVVSSSYGGWPAMLVGCIKGPDAGVLQTPDAGR